MAEAYPRRADPDERRQRQPAGQRDGLRRRRPGCDPGDRGHAGEPAERGECHREMPLREPREGRQRAGAVQGRARADRERFLLADVVEELAATVVGPDGGTPALEGEGTEHVVLDADFDQTYRILLNLVRNAFDAGARAVRLSGENTGDSAVIEVADDGPGMPEEVAARIGQDQRSGTEGGSGLGLRICADLCHNHGGALAVAARGPEGTRIRVTLPFAATG